jgi:outer membrane protein assembly factor BamB
MDVESGVIVIDLGLERGEPTGYAAPRRSTAPAWLPALLLALVVLACASTSAPPAKSPLSALFTLRVEPADAFALTGDGRLLAQSFGTLSSYDLTTGRLIWQAGQSTPAYRLRLSDGMVLMRPWSVGSSDPGTTAVSTVSGAVQWRRAGTVITIPGSDVLLTVTTVRSLSGPARRVQGDVTAISPMTGRPRWTVPVPSTAVLLGVPGPADEGGRMLLVRDDRTATLHDLATGRLLVSVKMPAADYGPGNPAVAGGLLLLRHPGDDGPELSAYDPVTLRQLWTEPATLPYDIQPCGRLACLTGAAGVRAIDPLTGDVRWSHPGWQAVLQLGPQYVAYESPDGTEAAGVIDPDTGRVRTGLDGWRPVGGAGGGSDGGDGLIVTKTTQAGDRTMVAVAHPGDARPRPLAELPTGTGDCQSVPGRLVCRTSYGELVVWAYRA